MGQVLAFRLLSFWDPGPRSSMIMPWKIPLSQRVFKGIILKHQFGSHNAHLHEGGGLAMRARQKALGYARREKEGEKQR